MPWITFIVLLIFGMIGISKSIGVETVCLARLLVPLTSIGLGGVKKRAS